jgi:isopentenyldiphosphate isomerase
MPEILDIYDDNLVKIGTKERMQAHLDGNWHRVFQCWIAYRDANGDDFLVVQRRGADKDFFPNLLDVTAAGHYQAGETIRDGIREVREELGIEVDYDDLIPLGLRYSACAFNGLFDREFADVFLLIHYQPIEDYLFDTGEVAGMAAFKIVDGLALCAGERRSILAELVMAQKSPHGYTREYGVAEITLADFVNPPDRYLLRILIAAQRALNGEKYLVV